MSAPLSTLRDRPLPDQADARRLKRSYATIRIDGQAREAAEGLVRAEDHGLVGRNHYAHGRNPPYWRAIPGAIDALWLREGVARRLAGVDARLREAGLRLFLYDAWRPRAVQAYFHDVWFPAELRRRRPELEGPALLEEVERYWSAPSEAGAPAPHATGGAVDLTLAWDGGAPLYMGSLFDDVTAQAHLDHYEAAGFSFSDEEARANRRVLYWVMREAGFSAHPDEWWHFSYGDQMWARLTGATAALYGEIEAV